MGDSQRWYDETEKCINSINEMEDIDFVLHGGDVSDFGLTDEFLWQRDIMNGLKVPYVVLLGNHDCLGTGKDTYMKVFGPTNFAFIAGNVKFVCLNTNALEFDYSEPIPDFNFIEKQWTERQDEFEKTVVAMHGVRDRMYSTIMYPKYSNATLPNIPDFNSASMRTTIDLLQTIFLKTASSITEATA